MTSPSRGSAVPQAMLLYVPITDSTSPYHSLVYLASFARSAGFPDIEIRDTNIEALNFCARPEIASQMRDEWQDRRRALGRRANLSGLEQLDYLQLVRAEAVDPAEVTAAIALMRDPVLFYDYPRYRNAAERVSLWLESLACSGVPGQFDSSGHALRKHGLFSLSSIGDLTNDLLLDRLAGPFRRYFHEQFFPELVRKAPPVVGINITYTSQLPYALWIVRQVRRLLPETFIVCGGTEVGGVWKYLRDRARMAELFEGADACVVGEGETAFVRLLESVLGHRPVPAIPNVVRFDRVRRTMAPPPAIEYENLDALPTPDYALMDSDLYFSPHRLVYYSPTRGCYWNKCTFCDYGLNFGTPTSPWRQVSIDRSVEDLRTISRYSRHVYLSVDVLAPARLLRLAAAIAEGGIDIRWAAEIRLERFFNPERCEVLRRSGCVAVSVGFEAGTQRILDLIDKGIHLPDVANTVESFSTAGIAVQMMGFTGFPSETHDEALASVEFLNSTDAWWSVSALGTFMLTPGAILAKKPTASGMEKVQALEGDDIVRTLQIEALHVDPAAEEHARALQEAKRSLIRVDFDRPFAGGIDAAHSIFYYDRFGRRFPRDFVVPAGVSRWTYDPDTVLCRHSGVVADERFDIRRSRVVSVLQDAYRRGATGGYALDAQSVLAELTAASTLAPAAVEQAYIVRADGAIIPCPPPVRALLDCVDGACSVADLEIKTRTTFSDTPLDETSAYACALSRVVQRGESNPEPADASRPHDVFRALVSALVDVHVLVPVSVSQSGTCERPPELSQCAT